MTFNPSLITPDFLEEKRKHTDPLADRVISSIISSGNEEKINEVFQGLVKNSDYDPSDFNSLPEKVRLLVNEYFEATSTLPDWADSKRMKKGEAVFSVYGTEISMLLNVMSLPLCYACANGAKVLYMTGRLSDRNGSIDPLARRLMETAQMIINTLAPGGMGPKGNGIVTIQKVRLIHASIRYFLKNPKFNRAGWDAETYGEPINQEDMAGTLQSFSALIINGLEQLNITLSDEEQDGYMHCWEVIGHMMGLDPTLIPQTYKQGWNLGIEIMKQQSAESDEGKELTRSCINFLKFAVPGNIFDNIPEYMIWYFVSDVSVAIDRDIAPMIGVTGDDSLKNKVLLHLSKWLFGELDELADHSKVIRNIASKFNRVLLQAFLKHFNEGKNVHFYIPPSLKKDWKLDDD